MFRFVFGFAMTLLIVHGSALGQGQQGQQGTDCFMNVTRKCDGMAKAGGLWHKACTVTLCQEDEFELGTIACFKPEGLVVWDNRNYDDIEQVPINTWGRSSFTTIANQISCGSFYTCTCEGKAIGDTCDQGAFVDWMTPVERRVTPGPANCIGQNP
jgi:hypothetical protein